MAFSRITLVLSSVFCGLVSVPSLCAAPFGNSAISVTVATTGQHLSIPLVRDLRNGGAVSPGEPFVLVLDGGRELRGSTMHLLAPPKTSVIAAAPETSEAALHIAGREMCADLSDPETGTIVSWCLIVRGESPYVRQEVAIKASARPLKITDVQLFHFHNQGARVLGSVAGSPVVSGTFYFGFEHPLSYATADDDEVVDGLKRTLPLRAGQTILYSSVIGTVRPGQLRRDFLQYVEMERAHPYRTFLHYNTWYDLRLGDLFDAEGIRDRMNSFGEELIRKRGVTMDSFLMDDGWDDTSSLWKFSSAFPQGFAPLESTAKSYGFGIGVWLSPWGGYAKAKTQRIAYGTSQHYEIVDGGYALSGPKYYGEFERACIEFIDKYGVNQFKFDGTGNAGRVFEGSIFDSDFSAAIHLIERLRQHENGVFINLTTGTKPSPFWLRYADSIWRSGEDHDFDGEGTWRQKWITYRDEQTYRNIVSKGPLFPLNSLMLHGIVYARKAKNLMTDPGNDFSDEVRSYFGSGTQVQELYLTPSLLTKENWDVLAESARWSRKNAPTLRDTHWVGGDPGKGELYGWASWNADHGILVLRNPTSRAQSITLDAQNVFELPRDAKRSYRMRSPWKADVGSQPMAMNAGTPSTFQLKPFEVLTLDSQ